MIISATNMIAGVAGAGLAARRAMTIRAFEGKALPTFHELRS